MTPQAQRSWLIIIALSVSAVAIALILTALNTQITFYKTPIEITAQHVGANIRIGGFVEPKSVRRKGTEIIFAITDFKAQVEVRYVGILPDLFRAGQGVIAEGLLVEKNRLHAHTIFAKHDENYQPPALKNIKRTPYDR